MQNDDGEVYVVNESTMELNGGEAGHQVLGYIAVDLGFPVIWPLFRAAG